ncbi:MAG: heparan-alpha-glucosaminide N-acetyltransferase domain-containing protein [Planctomycetaceae bacterium]
MGHTAAPLAPAAERTHSIDQFRGYTVLGMFVVNFLGHYPSHYNFHHNDYFLSYADTIMPMFLFVVGISFRMTLVRKLASGKALPTYVRYFRRSLMLCLISIVLNGIGQEFDTYETFFTDPQSNEVAESEWSEFQSGKAELSIPPHFTDRSWMWAKLFAKSYVWETLAVIGLTQLLILPLVHLGFWSRITALIVLGAGHIACSEWFNWQFFYGYTIDGRYIDPQAGLNNWMGELWGAGSNRGWDGGLFGILSWGFAMLAGTLCSDLMSGQSPRRAISCLLRWGAAFLLVGYGMSCLSRLYDVPDVAAADGRDVPAAADKRITNTHGTDKGGMPFLLAASPVIPDWSSLRGRSFTSLLADSPFVARPPHRLVNYWMMSKRFASLPYVVFVCGLSFVGLALFVVTTDVLGFQSSVLRTFGMNALIAYVLHKMVLNGLMFPVIPKDAAAWMYVSGLAVYLIIVYGMVRGLERQGVFVKI